jgi:hypothetical protein
MPQPLAKVICTSCNAEVEDWTEAPVASWEDPVLGLQVVYQPLCMDCDAQGRPVAEHVIRRALKAKGADSAEVLALLRKIEKRRGEGAPARKVVEAAHMSGRATAKRLKLGRSDTLKLLVEAGLLEPVTASGRRVFLTTEVEQLARGGWPSPAELRHLGQVRRGQLQQQRPGTSPRKKVPVTDDAGTIESWRPRSG